MRKKYEELFGDFLKKFEFFLQEAVRGQTRLHSMIHYSLFPGGKRFRPLLVYSAAFPVEDRRVYAAAAAVELAHNSSLVHDDLPEVDNSDFRRGKLSVHKKFGAAQAVMVGDALLAKAFELAAEAGCEAVSILARAMGENGVAGGQILDLSGASSLEELYRLYSLKTVSLIKASLLIGDSIAGRKREEMERFGEELGYLFQIVDDVSDWKDGLQEPNVVSLVGKEGAKQLAEKHYRNALRLSRELDSERLEFLTEFVYGKLR